MSAVFQWSNPQLTARELHQLRDLAMTLDDMLLADRTLRRSLRVARAFDRERAAVVERAADFGAARSTVTRHPGRL